MIYDLVSLHPSSLVHYCSSSSLIHSRTNLLTYSCIIVITLKLLWFYWFEDFILYLLYWFTTTTHHHWVLQYKHNHILAGHFGQNKTITLIHHQYTWPGNSISMDFIEKLPESSGYTAILIVVDQLTKQTIFISTHHTITSPQLAELFILHVFSEYRVPSHVMWNAITYQGLSWEIGRNGRQTWNHN